MSGPHDPVSVGDELVLTGVSQKGKNRVREHGNRWLVREVDKSTFRNLGYLVCPASYRGTPHLDPSLDKPSSIHQVDGYCRWVRKTNDEHFFIAGRVVAERVPDA